MGALYTHWDVVYSTSVDIRKYVLRISEGFED